MTNLTRDQILARVTGRGTATLPDGSTVGIRALTREEVVHMQTLSDADSDAYALSRCLVDPVLSVDDAALFCATATAGDVQAIIADVQALSGLRQGAGKSGEPGV